MERDVLSFTGNPGQVYSSGVREKSGFSRGSEGNLPEEARHKRARQADLPNSHRDPDFFLPRYHTEQVFYTIGFAVETQKFEKSLPMWQFLSDDRRPERIAQTGEE